MNLSLKIISIFLLYDIVFSNQFKRMEKCFFNCTNTAEFKVKAV
jgi:hypothetical protein